MKEVAISFHLEIAVHRACLLLFHISELFWSSLMFCTMDKIMCHFGLASRWSLYLHLSSLQSANIRTLWKDVVRMLNFRASFVYLNFEYGDGQVSWSHPGLANCSPFPMLFANVPFSRKTTIVAYRSYKRWFVYMKLDLNVEQLLGGCWRLAC
jgi:hypothetical protein